MTAPSSSPASLDPRSALRKELRSRREALSASERIAAANGLVAQLERIPEFLTDRRIAGYWAVGGELPLLGVMPGLRARGQTWHLPVVGEGRRLRFAPWRPGQEIVANRYGIPEPVHAPSEALAPSDIDLVLLPLLGFDRRGYRLGFGGGYYDRSFDFLREREGVGKPVLVGVGYALQEVAAIEAMPWDVRLDYVATERELIDLTPPIE
ncbi:5-formyltetrahydrofolate cyclo-ligase [Dokdonella sp.]|uniref:5-formyltetrahydrofolate cyclo-ligase n=1 Tax=Dokdonella sp. TaxID=2291710 RepID=UPI001B29CD5C|nr:5-formyltetrahydrofolate cyclo-ligase [Dokdonella sp.]MBO9662147.1 5-formyltetrahydrofolate cyclo-ligase [Dokdonella sp.]